MHQLAFKGSLLCASQNQLTPTLTDKLKGPSNQEQKSKDTEAQGLRSRPGRRKPCPKLLIFLSCLSCRQPRPESTLDASPYEGDTTPLLPPCPEVWRGCVGRNVPQADFTEGKGEALRIARPIVLWVTAVPCWDHQ